MTTSPTSRREELRKLAERVLAVPPEVYTTDEQHRAWQTYRSAANPQAVLELLDALELWRGRAESLMEQEMAEYKMADPVVHNCQSPEVMSAEGRSAIENIAEAAGQRLAIDSLRSQLADAQREIGELRAALGEACEIAKAHAEWNSDIKDMQHIAQLRTLVTPPPGAK